MKKTGIILLMALIQIIANAENKLYIEDFSIVAGETETVAIQLTNDVEIAAFSMEMTLPEGLSVASDEYGDLLEVTDRSAAKRGGGHVHDVTSNTKQDGTFALVLLSTSGASLTGNSGAVIYITFKASEDFVGNKTLVIKNVELTQSNLNIIKPEETTTAITGTSDINTVKQGNITEVERFGIDGKRIKHPVSGVNIVKYNDGTIKKEFVK